MTKEEKAAKSKKAAAEARLKWRRELPKVAQRDLVTLWLAHNRGIASAPKALQDQEYHASGYYYDGAKLFYGANGCVIAEQRKGYIQLVRVPSRDNILDLIGSSPAGNGPIVWVQNQAFSNGTAAKALKSFGRNYTFRTMRSPAELKTDQKILDAEARKRALYYKPKAVAVRAELDKLHSAYNDASNKLYARTYNLDPTADEIFKILGHDHVDGMMYKRLHERQNIDSTKIYRSNSGGFVWPALGDWTTEIQRVSLCNYGYHLTPKDYIQSWKNWGDHLFVAEGEGEGEKAHDKTVYKRARLVKYVGNVCSITHDQVAKLRGIDDVDTLKKQVAVADQAVADFRKKNAKYL
jgi:hypothetical protein